jgi:hypothetical protein
LKKIANSSNEPTEQDKDNKKKDTIVATLTYEVSDHKLMCTIQDDTTAPLFFEKVKVVNKTFNTTKFPDYVCEIITKVPDRKGSIEGSITNFRENKIPNMTRQVKFARYFSDHEYEIRQEKSNRFMLVDKRICTKLMEAGMGANTQYSQELEASQVLMYRSYLYTLKTTSHMIVKFKNQTYIRFPQKYAIIRGEGDEYKTGEIVLSDKNCMYGTCFDTRTYSCLRYKQRLKADSEDMMSLINTITKKEKVIPWSSTNDLTLSEKCNKFIYTNKRNQTLFACPVESVIWADATDESQSLPIESQKHMYTLPDFFTKDSDKITKLNTVPTGSTSSS